jgi:hypothetical protein
MHPELLEFSLDIIPVWANDDNKFRLEFALISVKPIVDPSGLSSFDPRLMVEILQRSQALNPSPKD